MVKRRETIQKWTRFTDSPPPPFRVPPPLYRKSLLSSLPNNNNYAPRGEFESHVILNKVANLSRAPSNERADTMGRFVGSTQSNDSALSCWRINHITNCVVKTLPKSHFGDETVNMSVLVNGRVLTFVIDFKTSWWRTLMFNSQSRLLKWNRARCFIEANMRFTDSVYSQAMRPEYAGRSIIRLSIVR